MDIQEAKRLFASEQGRIVGELKEYLSIPSVSADKSFTSECSRCADWVKANLDRAGFKTKLLQTSGNPVVHGLFAGPKGSPTIVLYGHYDVQPAVREDGWDTDPFVPTEKQGRIFARGAVDDKGPVFAFLKAAETLIKQQKLGCTIKIVLEGEEECGSKGISKAIPQWKEEISGDVLVVFDTNAAPDRRPAITLGFRGIGSLMVTLRGPAKDLHSGTHGGLAPNPAAHIARLISSLHNADGSIAVKGYLDQVPAPTSALKALVANTPFSEADYQKATGVAPRGGERGLVPLERAWLRPTIEINGIHSGYGGQGSKTIIPTHAFAKITTRLVMGQDPERCLALLSDHLKAHAPEGLTVEISEAHVHGPGIRVDPESQWVKKAKAILDRISDKGAALILDGASIPILSALSQAGGLSPMLVGLAQEEDGMHAANESYPISSVELGYIFSLLFLSEQGR